MTVMVFAAGLRGDTSGERFQRLGKKLMCPCKVCTYGALDCNHVGCPSVDNLRAELAERAQSKDSDDLILQSFVQEYGTQVLAVPSTSGFNLLAWIMPWIVTLIGLVLVVYLVRRWSARHARPAAEGAGVSPAVLANVHQEIERELEKPE